MNLGEAFGTGLDWANNPEADLPPDARRYGVGLVGTGWVARRWHVKAYERLGVRLVGAFDQSEEARAEAAEAVPGVRWFASYDDLLADPAVHVVDLATWPVGREELIARAVAAGKHVLAQKPAGTSLRRLADVAAEAERKNLKVAVNVNGRWAPPWRIATRLVQEGRLGDVQAVTHVYDTRMSWGRAPERHGSTQFLLFDYSTHWIDITRCWLAGSPVVGVRAGETDSRELLPDEQVSQSVWVVLEFRNGTTGVIRGVACASRHGGHPFWVHGTGGVVRGEVDARDGDYVEWEGPGGAIRVRPAGTWFPGGFVGALAELLRVIHRDEPPVHSLRDHLATLALVLAAGESARSGGRLVTPAEVGWGTRL